MQIWLLFLFDIVTVCFIDIFVNYFEPSDYLLGQINLVNSKCPALV